MDQKTDVRDSDEKVVEIEMERLRAFPNHPFKVIGKLNKNIIMEIEQSLLALGEIQMWVDFL